MFISAQENSTAARWDRYTIEDWTFSKSTRAAGKFAPYALFIKKTGDTPGRKVASEEIMKKKYNQSISRRDFYFIYNVHKYVHIGYNI